MEKMAVDVFLELSIAVRREFEVTSSIGGYGFSSRGTIGYVEG